MRAYMLFVAVLCSMVMFAQDSVHTNNRFFRLSGFALQYGISAENSEYISKDKLATIWDGFSSKPYYNYKNPSNSYFSDNNAQLIAYLTFDNYRKKKKSYTMKSQTLVGLVLSREQKLYYSSYDVTSRRNDTLTSSAGYPPIYRDFVTVNSTYLAYSVSSLGLDIQQIFSTQQEKILSLYAGFGISAQYSIKAQIEEQIRKKYGYYMTTNPSFDYQNANNFSSFYFSLANGLDSSGATKMYPAQKAMLYKIYIPFGLNIRLSQKEEKMVSNIYLFFQSRLGWESLKIQHLQPFYSGNLTLSGGIKYRF